MQNRPLEPWQIDHIRKMQEELGQVPPEAEEVTMDEGLGGLAAANAADDSTEADGLGALATYSDPNVQRAVDARRKIDNEYADRYNKLAKMIEEKRYGPSFSERMFQLSAALTQPTSRRGFGAVLGNVAPVLAAQEKAQREGEASRQEALTALQTAQLAQRMGLAKQDETTAIAMARINAAASKPPTMKSVIIDNGKAFDPVSGAPIVQPNETAWADLASDPSQANYDDFIRTFGPRFAEQAMRIVNYAKGGR